jgi:hypothetical protein
MLWKCLSFLSFVSVWAETSLKPDEDGIVRLDIQELSELASGICEIFGWKAKIDVPEGVLSKVKTEEE